MITQNVKENIKQAVYVANERTFLYQKLRVFADQLDKKRILDIGAGHQHYRPLFETKNTYEACDLESGFHQEKKPDFYASVYAIPREKETYDVVLLLQVLEHLEFPLDGLKEIHRILKKGGRVFISVPQAAGDHFEPHHYFNYTQYGLQSVLRQSGFRILEQYRLSGMFAYVGNRLYKLGIMTYKQYNWRQEFLQKLIALPFHLACSLTGYLISLFNFVDKKKNYCIGHIVIAQKD